MATPPTATRSVSHRAAGAATAVTGGTARFGTSCSIDARHELESAASTGCGPAISTSPASADSRPPAVFARAQRSRAAGDRASALPRASTIVHYAR
jgi:hypothetical protein